MSKKLKTWYVLANNKFKIKEEYSRNKNKQDFIKIIKQHFTNRIKNNKLIYDGEKIDIVDIKKDWKDEIEENEDMLRTDNFSIIISCVTLIAGMISTTFLANRDIVLETKFVILLFIMIGLYILFYILSLIDKYFKNSLIYNKSFYKMCLEILEDIEEDIEEDIRESKPGNKLFLDEAAATGSNVEKEGVLIKGITME